MFAELYLRVNPEIGRGSIMKLVNKVQQELEAGSSVFNRDLPPKLNYEAIQGELHRLIGSTQASCVTPLQNSVECCNVVKETLSRSAEGDDQDKSPRRKRKQWQKYKFVLNPNAKKEEINPKRPATCPTIL